MLNFPLILQVKLPAVDRIHLQISKCFTDMENKAKYDSKLNESSEDPHSTMLYHSHESGLFSFSRETAEHMSLGKEGGPLPQTVPGNQA